MTPLTIKTTYERSGYRIERITGFTPFQLDRLNRMPYQDMKVEIIKILFEKNGIQLKPEDILQTWVGADALFVETPKNLQGEITDEQLP